VYALLKFRRAFSSSVGNIWFATNMSTNRGTCVVRVRSHFRSTCALKHSLLTPKHSSTQHGHTADMPA
jgi:hypothetical protein